MVYIILYMTANVIQLKLDLPEVADIHVMKIIHLDLWEEGG